MAAKAWPSVSSLALASCVPKRAEQERMKGRVQASENDFATSNTLYTPLLKHSGIDAYGETGAVEEVACMKPTTLARGATVGLGPICLLVLTPCLFRLRPNILSSHWEGLLSLHAPGAGTPS